MNILSDKELTDLFPGPWRFRHNLRILRDGYLELRYYTLIGKFKYGDSDNFFPKDCDFEFAKKFYKKYFKMKNFL